ncbi:HIRA-interacting protein 5 [Pilatotrama ljubarskyi]|nr:HIRA-interacting protein 5 [Pilatotrama ljubarskyi]
MLSSSSFASSSLRAVARAPEGKIAQRVSRTSPRAFSASRHFASSSRRSASTIQHHGPTLSMASPTRVSSVASIVRRIDQSRSMFIQTETTPNEDSLKFIPGVPVMGEGTAEFLDTKSALKSPLALRLMGIEGVTEVFYGPDFVTVSKDPETSWSVIKPEVYAMLMEHFSSGEPLFRSEEDRESAGPQDTRILETDSETVAMIKELLETRVRPAIMEDGGDIEYRGFTDDGIVQLKLKGSCRGCSSSTVTLKSGIERMLMHYIPEVKGVEEVLDQEEEIALREFEKLEQKLSKEHGSEKKDSSMAQYMSV